MRKLLLFTFFLMGCMLTIKAQERLNVDSIKKLVQISKEDTAKVKLLYKLQEGYFASNIDSAFKYLEQQLTLSQKLSYSRGMGEVYEGLSTFYYRQNNLQKGIEYTYKALRLAEKTNDSYLVAGAYNSVGNMHSYQGNNQEALAAFKKGYEFISVDNLDDRAVILGNIGRQFYRLNQLDSAIAYTEECRQLYTKTKSINLAKSFNFLSSLYYQQGNNTLGEAYLKMAVETATRTNNQNALATYYFNITNRFLAAKRNDSALYNIKKALEIYQHLKAKEPTATAYGLLAEIYQLQGSYDSAYVSQTKRVDLINEINADNNRVSIQALQFEEQLRQREVEAKEVEMKQERKNNLQYAAVVFGIVSLLIVFLVLSHSVIANQKLIRFLGVISLLIVFEFLNLLLHPWLGAITHHSPVLMLLSMVCVGALLVPLHHRLEHWITHKMVEKNNAIRLAAAKRTIQELEASVVDQKH